MGVIEMLICLFHPIQNISVLVLDYHIGELRGSERVRQEQVCSCGNTLCSQDVIMRSLTGIRNINTLKTPFVSENVYLDSAMCRRCRQSNAVKASHYSQPRAVDQRTFKRLKVNLSCRLLRCKGGHAHTIGFLIIKSQMLKS